jgi:tRNA(fMet)-specific endonuclease VapC
MIIDTDFAIWYLKKDKKTLEKFDALISEGIKIYTTHVTVWELYKGAYYSSKTQENLKKITTFLQYIPVLPFSLEIGKRFADLYATLEQKGEKIGEMDTLISAIAIEYDYPILTRNVKHFEKTEAKIETW